MNYTGGIDGMNFTPISNYNGYLKNNMSFDIDSNMDFENILSKQTAQLQNSQQIQGGIQMNNFDDVLAQSSVQGIESNQPTENMLNSFSKSIGHGLKSTNDSIIAADKAQEAFATGENISVHDVMIAAEKASLNMGLTMQLRNKLMQAYTELNNVRV